MNQDKIKKIRISIIERLNDFIDDEFNGNKSKAAEYLGESRMILNSYLNGHREGLIKLIELLDKTKKYEFTFKIKRR